MWNFSAMPKLQHFDKVEYDDALSMMPAPFYVVLCADVF